MTLISRNNCSHLRKITGRVVSIIFGLFLSFITMECILYIKGYPSNGIILDYQPGSHEPDLTLGWKHKPGTYYFADSRPSFPTLKVSYLPDGSRATNDNPTNTSADLLLLGCSFTEGFGLDDKNTFAWKLQQLLADISVRNFGTAGYGTLQSFLIEKQLLALHANSPPRAIIYGFADFHQVRNVKNPATQRFTDSPGIYPYCDLHTCSTWTGKPVKNLLLHSRFFSFIENQIEIMAFLPSSNEMEQITMNLIRQMNDLATQFHSRFIVAPVSLQDPRWLELFARDKISTFDCDSPILHAKPYLLEDGHPNELWSTEFANCLRKKVNNLSW